MYLFFIIQQLTEQLRHIGLYAADTTGDVTLMRQPGTYPFICFLGAHSRIHYILQAAYDGHLELSAFAHMKKCNVKTIQPGLVYLLE
jgi:hypothetical protein